MNNHNEPSSLSIDENSPPIDELIFSVFDDLDFLPPADDDEVPLQFTREYYEYLINAPIEIDDNVLPVNEAGPAGVIINDTNAQTNGNNNTVEFVAIEANMEENNIGSTIGTIEVANNNVGITGLDLMIKELANNNVNDEEPKTLDVLATTAPTYAEIDEWEMIISELLATNIVMDEELKAPDLFASAARNHYEIEYGTMNIFDANHEKRKTSKFSLDERLQGWRVKTITRPPPDNRTEKFHIHIKSDVQFRSLNEVDDFVYFGCHPKRRIRGVKPNSNGAREASTSKGKRSIKRKLNWEMRSSGISYNGNLIYDIHFLEPEANQDVDSSPVYGVHGEKLFSSEGKGTKAGVQQKSRKKRKTMKMTLEEERMKAFRIASNRSQGIVIRENKEDEDKDKDQQKDCHGKGKGKMYEE